MPNRTTRKSTEKPLKKPPARKPPPGNGKRAAPLRTRKKTAAPPIARRTTGLRPRSSTSPDRPTPQPQAPCRPGFPDIETALRYLLSRAEELVQDGVLPRLGSDLYLDALVPVLTFIYARADLFREANLGPEVCGAVEQIAQELHAAPDAPLDAAPGGTKEHEAVSTGALLLTAYRDAIRRVARGPRGLLARTHFGVGDPFDVSDPEQVATGIETFLQGAVRHPEYITEAGFSKAQMEGLAVQRRVIVARAKYREKLGVPSRKNAQRTRVLHSALEYFFDRFSAAVSVKLFDQPEERLRGLRLVPRDTTGRSGGLRSTDPR